MIPGGEHEVHAHEEPEGGLVGEGVAPLRAADLVFRFGRGSRGGGGGGERVVDGHHGAEEGGGGVCGGGLGDPDCCRGFAREHVVEVDLELG